MQAYLGFDICNKMQALKTVKKTLETPKDYKKQSKVKRFEKERNNGDERRSEWVDVLLCSGQPGQVAV